MLVVLAVIGVATGATMLGVNASDRSSRAQSEAVRLANNLSLGVDEAMVSGTPLALIWDQDGYSFVAWSAAEQDWRAAAPSILATRHTLRDPLQLAIDGKANHDPILIAPSGLGSPITFVLSSAALSDTASANGVGWIVNFDGFSATAKAKEGM
jgi:general secretion pathway protein H